MWSYIKRMFKGNGDVVVPATKQFYSPLRIALHSTVELKTVDWVVIQANLHPQFKVPDGKFSVLAIGQMDVNDDKVYNIYLMDQNDVEYMLQLFCGKNRQGIEEVFEATLYQQVVSIAPTTSEGWDENLAAIGLRDIQLDDITYARTWGDGHDNKSELVKFNETVVVPNTGIVEYVNHYMLYSREITTILGTVLTENLLVGIEERDDSASIAMQIGLKVPTSDLNII